MLEVHTTLTCVQQADLSYTYKVRNNGKTMFSCQIKVYMRHLFKVLAVKLRFILAEMMTESELVLGSS